MHMIEISKLFGQTVSLYEPVCDKSVNISLASLPNILNQQKQETVYSRGEKSSF